MPSHRTTGALRGRQLVTMFAVTAILMALFAATAQAGTITVTNTGDGPGVCPSASECTLRKAVETATAGETIALPAGTYTLTSEVTIEKDLTIAGAGQSATTLTTSAPSRLLYVDDSELTLSGITLKKGVAPESEGEGGAVYVEFGALRVNDCTFTEDTASHSKIVVVVSPKEEYEDGGEGGAIYSDEGKLSISATTFTNDTAEGGDAAVEYDDGGDGGAIYSYGNLKIASSTFSDNKATGGSSASATKQNDGGEGGAVYADEGLLSIAGSAFSGNVAGGGATAEGGKKGGDSGYGGALYSDAEATIATSTFDGANTAAAGAGGSGAGEGGEGGAIYNDESLTLSQSIVSGNVAGSTPGGNPYGGGIDNDGSASIVQSTVADNQASGGYGGGVYDGYLELELVQSTVGPGNKAEYGGGIYNEDPLSATNSTIAENIASSEGGGIYNENVGTLANVTLYGNTAEEAGGGGNLYLDEYELRLHDTLIAAGKSPTSGGNCAFNGTDGSIVSEGYNAEDSNQCQLDGPGDQVNVALDLGTLAGNGGPIQTVALMAGSAAIDKGDPAGCTSAEGELLTVDQRGVTRPQNGRCDVGAYEYVPPVSPPPPPPAPKATAPKLSGLTVSPSSFKPNSGSASIARHHKGKKSKGTTVSYSDTEAASTTFTVVELEHGYRVGKGLCKVASGHGKKPKHGKPCIHEVTLKGSFVHADLAGHNQFEFTGHVDGQKLAKGSYVLIASPRLSGLTGSRVSAAFKIS